MGPLLRANPSCAGSILHPKTLNSTWKPLTLIVACRLTTQAASGLQPRGLFARNRTNSFVTGSVLWKRHHASVQKLPSSSPRYTTTPRCAEIGLFSWQPDINSNPSSKGPAIVYVPGSDGTGTAISPQVSQLQAQGYDVYSLVLPTSDRSSWQQLANRLKQLLRRVRAAGNATNVPETEALRVAKSAHVTLVAESFGAWIALLCAAQAPHLVDRVVLLNPATRFAASQPLLAAISNAQVLQVAPTLLYSTILDVMVAPIMTPFQPATISSPETGAAKTPGSKPSTAGEGLQYGTPVATPGGASTRRKRGASDGGAADASSARALIQSLPKDSAAHRLRLMVEGMGSPAQEDAVLDNVTQPVLLLASAKDQVIDSVGETRRLESKMQRARARASRGAARMVGRAKDKAPAAITRVILPNCSHMPLLEAPFSLAATLRKHGFTAPTPMPVPAPVTAPSPTTPPLQAPVVIQASSSIAVAALDSASSAVRTLADTPATPSTVVIAEGSYVEAQSVRADAEPLSGAVASTFSQASLTVIVPAGAAGEMGREGDGADVLPELRARKDSPRARPSRRAGGEGELGRGLGDDQSDYHPSNLDELGRMLEPWRLLTSPKIFGAENLPRDACKNKRPVLFVGNHGLYGFYDSPLIFHELHLQGFTCRAMAHPNIMNGPLGPLFKRYGSVKATPQGMFNALKNGENVLLFPGGARDVHKKKVRAVGTATPKDTGGGGSSSRLVLPVTVSASSSAVILLAARKGNQMGHKQGNREECEGDLRPGREITRQAGTCDDICEQGGGLGTGWPGG
eukprot:jgi/Mesvir1/19283/Mv10358-RA.2